MSERIVSLDIGCLPKADVSGAILLQDEYRAFLVFNARQRRDGKYVDAGRAIVEFDLCWITKFGYPNEEAWHSIPRTTGLSFEVYEVLDSNWTREITRLNRHAFPDTPDMTARHFLFLFHDSSFECVANGFSVALSTKPLSTILAELSAQILKD